MLRLASTRLNVPTKKVVLRLNFTRAPSLHPGAAQDDSFDWFKDIQTNKPFFPHPRVIASARPSAGTVLKASVEI